MKDINPLDEIVDDITKHSLELQKLSNNVSDKTLKKKYKELSAKLNKYATEVNLGDLSKNGSVKEQQKIMKELLRKSNLDISKIHAETYQELQDTLRDIGDLETNFSRNSINKAVTGSGNNLFASSVIGTRRISENASNMITQGAPQKELWSRQSKNVQNKFKDIIRNAYQSGEDMATTVGKISGTRAANYKDGLMRKSYNQSNTLARTSILTMSNTIRQETYAANKDVLRGMEFLSHLDGRTTQVCRAHSGDKWVWMPDGSLKTIAGGHDYVEPPLHFNCRSTLIPIVKSASSLSPEKLEKVPKKHRKLIGNTSLKDKYTDADKWLKTQTAEFQEQVLGKAHKLWEDGKVSFQRFVTQKGRLRTPQDLYNYYMRKELVPKNISSLKTAETFKAAPGVSKQYVDELATVEKGKFLQTEEKLMAGKSVSAKQSDLVGRVMKNADPTELEYANKFDPLDFEGLVGSKDKRLAFYNHTSKRYSRFDKLAKGDLMKRTTGKLSETDQMVKKELIEKIMKDDKMSRARKEILIDMFDESGKIVGTQRALPMTESLFTLARKKDFSDIDGDFVGYLQRAQENSVNSYFARAKRLEIKLGQGVEKELRYSTLTEAAKNRQMSAIKAEANSLGDVSEAKGKMERIGSRKLRNFDGEKATANSVNLELPSSQTITNYLNTIDETRMTNAQVSSWIKRVNNGKKQQAIIARTDPGDHIGLSDRFLNLKEFEKWKENAWSGRGFPPAIRDEVGEVLGDVQTYQNLKKHLRGRILAPKDVIERGMNADEYIDVVLTKYLKSSNRASLELNQFMAKQKINRLYNLNGESRALVRTARAEKAKRELEGTTWEKFKRKMSRTEDSAKLDKKRASTLDDWTKQSDAEFIKKTAKSLEDGISADILNPKAPFFKQAVILRREDLVKVSKLTNQELFAGINKGGSYTDVAKKLGEKYYWQFKGVREVDEDEAIRMGNFLINRMEKAGIIEKFKSVSLVREFDWEPPKESTMWMIKAKSKTWENAVLANKKNYEFDGLPRLTPPKYDSKGFYEDGTAAIRGTNKDDVEKMLKPRSTKPAIDNLNYESATGIKINNYVLDTQTELERRGVGIGNIIPKKATSKLDVAAKSERQAWDMKRKLARALKDDTFYNGMSNDKYARTYSTNLGLQWQGDHVSKGLMLFDKGVKMGKYGEDAFKQEFINVALNGFDKLPIKVRKQVYDLIPDKMIRDAIKDPVKNDWWHKKTDWFEAGLLKKDLKGIPKEWADEVRKLAKEGEPDGAWNFLSLLKERDEMIAWKKKGKKVEDFLSHKQLQVDGTTNVLQHLSGISRDSAMADRVNMVVRPKVADAYIAVRGQLDDIARKLDDADPLKKFIDQDKLQLPHGKRRKSVKHGLMVYQYNAGPGTMGDLYFKALETVLVDGKPIFKTASKSERLAVGRLIARASDEVFPNSGNVKSLLNNFAEAHEIAGKKSIEYKTELGFPFRQQYNKKGVRQLSIPDGNGGTMQLNLSVDLDEIDWAKQNRAFAPNIIHSMDATHKSMVVNKLKQKYGVDNFSMIHDSFIY